MKSKKAKKYEIVHFTIEDISSGLFRRQVLETVFELSKQDSSLDFEIVVINRVWHLRSHLQSLKMIRAELDGKSIRIKYLPLLPPLRNALKSVLISRMITSLLTFYAWIFLNKRVDLIHCRSYWPTIAALNAGIKNILFDMRSLLPAESVSTGELSPGTSAHRYWLALEKRCLKGAKISTGVSQGMVEYARNIAPGSNVELVPISFKLSSFRFDQAARILRREQLGWKDDDIILVYSI